MGMAGQKGAWLTVARLINLSPAWWHMLPTSLTLTLAGLRVECEQLKSKQNREEKGKMGPFQARKEQNNI